MSRDSLESEEGEEGEVLSEIQTKTEALASVLKHGCYYFGDGNVTLSVSLRLS
jgi:hypothetical protein